MIKAMIATAPLKRRTSYMAMTDAQHTPGPWPIDWYECTADAKDVACARANPKKVPNPDIQIGGVLWRAARGFGPIGITHSHWGGYLLEGDEEDIILAAAAPELLSALLEARSYIDGASPDWHYVKQEMLAMIDGAIAKARGQTEG